MFCVKGECRHGLLLYQLKSCLPTQLNSNSITQWCRLLLTRKAVFIMAFLVVGITFLLVKCCQKYAIMRYTYAQQLFFVYSVGEQQ